MSKYNKLSAVVAIGAISTLPTISSAQTDGYMNNQSLSDTIQSIASSSDHAWESTIGTSLDGSPIRLITLAGSADSATTKPAMLITAGIDGRYLAGTETATRIAQQILNDHSEILESMTIYIIPRVNPDGAHRNLNRLTMGHSGNNRLVDDDRDRSMNEDDSDDLNGDGLITMMRRLNPPIDDPATHLADPSDPRLNIEPDHKEDQRTSFTLYSEGLDNDGDGRINEDGFGSVDLDMNFMHRWDEHGTHAGRYPLSEPESMALAKFVLNHDNIVMAVTLGRHDNLINQPDSKAKDITGTAPKVIDSNDADLYKQTGELFKDATGFKYASKEDISGSFHAWLYAQRGIPSFAVNPWSRPEPQSDDKDKDSGADSVESNTESEPDFSGLTPSGIGDISQETIDELMAAYEAENGEPVDNSMIASVTPEMIVGFAAQAGIVVQRVKISESLDEEPAEVEKPKKKKKSEDAKWIEYFEQAGINGFVDWQPFDHPTLGEVEIGGFVPLSKINPPADQLDSISEKLTQFVVDLTANRPEISIVGPEIKELASGLYEVRISIVNHGKMPTSTSFSQTKHTIRPTVVRLSTEVDKILTGQRVSRIWGINAHGGHSDHRWIIRSDNIKSESITILDPRFGKQTLNLGL